MREWREGVVRERGDREIEGMRGRGKGRVLESDGSKG